MKVLKEELEKFTEEAAEIAKFATILLLHCGCPDPDAFKQVESFAGNADKLRVDLGLKPLNPELASGMLSSTVLTKSLMASAKGSGRGNDRTSIGFQVTDAGDPSKMN